MAFLARLAFPLIAAQWGEAFDQEPLQGCSFGVSAALFSWAGNAASSQVLSLLHLCSCSLPRVVSIAALKELSLADTYSADHF